MKFREHRGLLEEAMKTLVELDGTLWALARHLGVPSARVEVKPYIYDPRLDWNTHIVTVNGMAVGFTDGPLVQPLPEDQLCEENEIEP